eukprot:CAMPEP_0184478520 /NCGR_PEP_ID=MMETSP0113_2-20130426/522_1 /TAXON_ID=91329 /ORGANISM="Norrisiella sphaerica, Strain BC52" /LENGTH=688 /DNA_ID=CAMNT_0026856343 /DNA_START=280 /DNA_END=2346 /DNA_ORIENTATION=-
MCDTKWWSIASPERRGMKSQCSGVGSSLQMSVSECRAATCNAAANAFNYQTASKTCQPLNCANGDLQLSNAQGWEVYSLVNSKPTLVLYEVDSDCPVGMTRIHMLRNDQKCHYHGPCPSTSQKLALASFPATVNVPAYSFTHQCLSLNTSEVYWTRDPVFVDQASVCSNETTLCDAQPEQIRLTLARPVGSSVTVEWATYGPADPILRFSSSASVLSAGGGTSVMGNTTSYTVCGQDCGDEHNTPYCSPRLHWATITGLTPGGAQYYYSVGDINGEFGTTSVSEMKEFKTVSPPSIKDYPQHIGILGDMGQTVHSEATCEEIQNDTSLEYTILVGDMSYADGYGPRWDSWGRLAEKCFSEVPLVLLPGNHEIEYESDSQEAFKGYRNRFHMPSIQEEQYSYNYIKESSYREFGNSHFEYGASYYSLDIGPAHLIFLNTYTDSHKDSLQYAWLLSDLQSVDRNQTPWLFVFMHAPMYNSNVKHVPWEEEPTTQMKDNMEELFYQYGVNVVFAGHVHAYERFLTTFDTKLVKDAPYYITIGDAGNREKLYNDWPNLLPFSNYRNALFYGSGRLTLMNDSMALWEWEPNSKNGSWDTYWITRQQTLTSQDNSNTNTQDDKSEDDSGVVLGVSIAIVILVFLSCLIVCYRFFTRHSRKKDAADDGLVRMANPSDNPSHNPSNNPSVVEEIGV